MTFIVTCKSFGDVILLPFPGLVVLIGRPLVVLRQPAALLLSFSVRRTRALCSHIFIGGIVELHPAPRTSSSWAALQLCWCAYAKWGTDERQPVAVHCCLLKGKKACWDPPWLELVGRGKMTFAQLSGGSGSHIGGLNKALGKMLSCNTLDKLPPFTRPPWIPAAI